MRNRQVNLVMYVYMNPLNLNIMFQELAGGLTAALTIKAINETFIARY